jgi:hypothetical protein
MIDMENCPHGEEVRVFDPDSGDSLDVMCRLTGKLCAAKDCPKLKVPRHLGGVLPDEHFWIGPKDKDPGPDVFIGGL